MNGKARPLRDAAKMTRRRRSASQMTLISFALIVLAAIQETRGEYLMGGHLDNKEEQPRSSVISRRSDEDTDDGSTVISSRTATSLDDLDRDFDLGLDLLADQSSVDPTRASLSYSDDAEARDEEESGIAPRYRVPIAPYAFNGGQPFSLEKDPITGQIDFEKAPPLKVLDYSTKSAEEDLRYDSSSSEDEASDSDTTSSVDSKTQRDENLGPNEINPYSPSFHDFLNLPSRYTYENSEKYPLISSSYANTKVQSGANSYNTHNHKKYHEAVKAGVDVSSLYVQPVRKVYQPVTRSTTTRKPSTTQFTTTEPTTTTTKPVTTTRFTTTSTTTTTTTTMSPLTTRSTPKRLPSKYAPVTTWKPQRPSHPVKYSGEVSDYEGTLPIERLQTTSTTEKQTSTEPSRYVLPVKTNSDASSSDEYDDSYDDYDRIFQTGGKPSSENNQNNDSDGDYGYGGLDLIGETNSQSTTESAALNTEKNLIPSSDNPTTYRPTSSSISNNDRRPTFPSKNQDNASPTTTTLRTSTVEEKRVTSMPLDTIVDNYRPSYGSNVHQEGIDHSLPSVTSNVVYQQLRPPSKDQFYGRPSMSLPAPGIVVKSTSNVVVPPGQDTVSFVLGNRQSVGSVSDAGGDFYSVHSGSINERPPIAFGKIGSSRPVSPDNYPGQMIVSAGIGVGQNAGGQTYNQRPAANGSPFDHALVSVGMPTVEVASPGDTEVHLSSNTNKNSDSSTNSLETLAQKWWSSTSAGSTKNQQTAQESSSQQEQQFGYRVVFPDGGSKLASTGSVNENSAATQRPIEEHVIVIHEKDIGAGNKLDIELPSQPIPTSNPTTSFFFETTTQRGIVSNEEKPGLPELSESLTPPAEQRPSRVPITTHRPPSYYNYHHHPLHNSGNSRPNDYRDQRPQRVPLPPPPPPKSSSSSSGYKRRQPSTTLESNLPNILPQFRPNAKTSHGHNRGETIGTIPAGAIGHYPTTWFRRQPPHHHHHQPHRSSPSRPPRPSSSPSHLQRLNPPPLPPLPPPISSLRLPTPAALVAAPSDIGISNHDSQPQNSDEVSRVSLQKRLHKVSVGVPPSLAIDERHHQSSNAGPIKSRLEDENLEKFSAEPPNQPPRAPFFSKRTASTSSGADQLPEGMPRIATLQMIQQHGSRDDDALRPNLPPPYRYNSDNSNRHEDREKDSADVVEESSARPSLNRRADETSTAGNSEMQADEGTRADYGEAAESPVYVVYPVKGALDIRPPSHGEESDPDDDGSVVLGTYGSQRPLPPDTLLQDTSENESSSNGEEIYRPSSVNVSPPFTDSSSPQLASDFPYPLERPDPSMFTSQLREKPLLVPSDYAKGNQRPDLQEEEDEEGEEDKNIDRGDEANAEEEETRHDFEKDANVNVIPYPQDHLPFALRESNTGPISATLHRLGGSSIVAASSTPIAYVYTPTMRTPIRRPEEIYHHANFEHPVLLPSQQASSSSSSAPAPQSFMAPFVASASAEAPTKNGWSVVMVGSPAADGSSMDRRRGDSNIRGDGDKETSQSNEDEKYEDKKTAGGKDEAEENNNKFKAEELKSTEGEHEKDEQETQTEKSEFDVENFTPQLFGGFKPIFEFPADSDTMGDKVSGDPMVERPRSSSGTEGIGQQIRVSDV